MTWEEKIEIFQQLLKLAIYEYEFVYFLKTKIDFIEIKLSNTNDTTQIIDFLEEMYQYYVETREMKKK